jgi:hypothetical protein
MPFAFHEAMKSKSHAAKSQTRAQASHPEVQKRRASSGSPGPESSKASNPAKDARNRHDQDGNGEQLRK